MTSPLIPSQRVELLPLTAAQACDHRPAWALGDSALLRVDGSQLVVRLAPCQRCGAPLLGVAASVDVEAEPTWFVVTDSMPGASPPVEVGG